MTPFNICLGHILLIVFLLHCSIADADGNRLVDSGFEDIRAASLEVTGDREGWEVQKTGREEIQPKMHVACVEYADQAKSRSKAVELFLPSDTVGFEFVTIGQRVQLVPGKEYEASVWVRWPSPLKLAFLLV